MRHLAKTFAVVALAMTTAPAFAQGYSGCESTPTNHTVNVQKNGFFPSKIFVCPGDKIYFLNRTGYWAKFNQSWGNDNSINIFNSYWMSNGATVGPLNVQMGMGTKIENLDLWNVSNYTYDMEIVYGPAPDSY